MEKIVLNKKIDITDYELLINLMNEYEDVVDKVYISISGIIDYVSLIDCYKLMYVIKRKADEIRDLKLSNIETVMYVYDIVRNRKCIFDNENNLLKKLGYPNLFNSLLYYIGIENYNIYLVENDNPLISYVRNTIYLKDDKYNIDGVYYFDFACNKKGETNEYLKEYSLFAKTRCYMDSLNSYDFKEISFPIYSIDMYKKVRKIIEDKNYEELMPYIRSINYMSNLVKHSKLISFKNIIPVFEEYGKFDEKEFLNKFEIVFNKFNNEIPAETMLRVLNNVRKVEYYQNSILYPYSLEDMYETCIKSNWKFALKHLDTKSKMLQRIFGKEIEINEADNYKNYGNESGLFKEIEQVKFTKILKLVSDKKS